MGLTVTGSELARYDNVYVYAATGANYNVTMELWTADPTGAPLALIAGTTCVHSGLTAGTIWNLPCGVVPGIIIPSWVWMMLTFSTNDAGWLITECAETGFTDDFFWQEGEEDLPWFGGYPWAGFAGTIRAAQQPPVDISVVYENIMPMSGFYRPGAEVTVGDDMGLTVTGSELAGYDNVYVFAVFGRCQGGPYDTEPCKSDASCSPGTCKRGANYDVTMELWTDDGSGRKPSARIDGTTCVASGLTTGWIQSLRCGVPAGIILPSRVWMMLTFSTNDAGWVLSGDAEVGFTDVFSWEGGYPSGVCAEKVCVGGANDGHACVNTDPDCPGGVCAEKVCAGGTNDGAVCTDPADCQTCSNKKCSGAPPNTVCTGTGQGTCPSGQTCDFVTCTMNADCPPGGNCGVCADKVCARGVNAGELCTMDSDCNGAFCFPGCPWAGFAATIRTGQQPPVQIDVFESSFAQMELYVEETGWRESITLTGPTTVHVFFRGVTEGAANDSDGNGLDEVDTEMVDMQLAGNSAVFGRVLVTLNADKPSRGQIEEQVNNTPGTLDLPPFAPAGTAYSFFDVFFKVEVEAAFPCHLLHNETPKHMKAKMTRVPPLPGEPYEFPEMIPLVTETGASCGFIIDARHIPRPIPAKLVLPLSFVRVGNSPGTRGRWTVEQVKAFLAGVNAIWNLDGPPKEGAADPNIQFIWPQQYDPMPFHDIPDPQKDIGGDGDVKDGPPLPPEWVPDPKVPTEIDVLCTNAHANARAEPSKRKEFPIILIQHFVDATGKKTNTLGLTTQFHAVDLPDNIDDPPKIMEQKGHCLIISIQAKTNPTVLAHELGHVLCLDDLVPDAADNNLMEGTKDPVNTSLNEVQTAAARKCLPLVLENLQDRPPLPLGACCDHDPFGACTDEVTEAQCVCEKCEWFDKQACVHVACTKFPIPAVSEWGLVVLTLLLLTGAKVYFGRRSQAAISR
jgi:hypothetical protein